MLTNFGSNSFNKSIKISFFIWIIWYSVLYFVIELVLSLGEILVQLVGILRLLHWHFKRRRMVKEYLLLLLLLGSKHLRHAKKICVWSYIRVWYLLHVVHVSFTWVYAILVLQKRCLALIRKGASTIIALALCAIVRHHLSYITVNIRRVVCKNRRSNFLLLFRLWYLTT